MSHCMNERVAPLLTPLCMQIKNISLAFCCQLVIRFRMRALILTHAQAVNEKAGHAWATDR